MPNKISRTMYLQLDKVSYRFCQGYFDGELNTLKMRFERSKFKGKLNLSYEIVLAETYGSTSVGYQMWLIMEEKGEIRND